MKITQAICFHGVGFGVLQKGSFILITFVYVCAHLCACMCMCAHLCVCVCMCMHMCLGGYLVAHGDRRQLAGMNSLLLQWVSEVRLSCEAAHAF